jgi:two-component system, NtrC family, sensor histidine kinase PilS
VPGTATSRTPPPLAPAADRLRRDSGGLAGESLTGLTPTTSPDAERRRRVTYLMFFRVVLMTLVLGATSVLYWLSDVDLASPGAFVLYAIIAATYLATIVYAVLLRRGAATNRLVYGQLVGDLVVASILIHATGGAQSAYTFFLPLTIIGAATVLPRNGALTIAIAAAILFAGIALLGWNGALPAFSGQRIRPHDLTAIELSRALGLNLAAIVGVSLLAINLSTQLQVASANLASQQSAAADLLTLHGDIVRCLSSGLVTVDGQGRVSTINEVACEILGLRPEQVTGVRLEEVLPGISALTAGLGSAESLQRGELAVPRGDGALVLGVSISPLNSASGQFLGRVINFQDLTDLREMEHHIKRAERLAVVGGMAAGVAHEIRNPLASISGSIELLRSMPQTDPDSSALMGIVTREIDRLNGLLTELLDYTNPRSSKMTPCNLSQLIRDTVQVFAQDPELGKVELRVDDASGPDGVEIAADPAKLRQVLWNLLRNGAESAGRGGGHVRVELRPGGDTVELAVIDDGPGVAPEHRERIFDPFFTTKTKGHGLGLAMVQNIVVEHGGLVRLDSRPGEGARFTVQLPYTQAHGR